MPKRKSRSVRSKSRTVLEKTRKQAHDDGYKTTSIRKLKDGYSFSLK